MNRLERIKEKGLTRECEFSASRSSGPGGQNVNKVNSQVSLRFDVNNSVLLEEEEKKILLQKLASHISGQGILIITVQTHRSQLQNKEEAISKFNKLIEKAFTFNKVRKASKPTKAAVKRRLEDKRNLAQKKKDRQKP
jgi:ribosome-associated protein